MRIFGDWIVFGTCAVIRDGKKHRPPVTTTATVIIDGAA